MPDIDTYGETGSTARARPGLGRLRVAAMAVVAAALVVGASARAQDDDARVVRYTNNALTVRLHNAPLRGVLDELGRQSGAEVRGELRMGREVTVDFEAVPLSEALQRLLGDQNFVLIYGDGDRLRAVELLGGALALPPPGTVLRPPPVDAVAAAPATPGTLMSLMGQRPPVPVEGKLAAFLGADSATFMQLMEVSMRNEDVMIRMQAVHTGIRAIEADAELRSTVMSVIGGMTVDEINRLTSGAPNDRAEELFANIASQARTPELRAKASNLLNQIRRAKAGG